ncbi:MAG: NADH-quinone oxidoreductase subunit M, partial [Promicromonosporaceae bacterium]|nr:NADH-quinone oxidoreductase subunit M [Promicromonosporaceae bacterium]
MFIWLILLIAWPLLAAAGTALAGRNARVVALAGSLVQVGWMAGALSAFDASRAGGHQLTHTWRWIPGLGASFAIGVDGVGLLLLAMATLLVPLVILAAWREQPDGRQAARYLTLVLVLQAFISVILAARDLFLFYVVFEAMLIPAYLLI